MTTPFGSAVVPEVNTISATLLRSSAGEAYRSARSPFEYGRIVCERVFEYFDRDRRVQRVAFTGGDDELCLYLLGHAPGKVRRGSEIHGYDHRAAKHASPERCRPLRRVWSPEKHTLPRLNS